MQTCDGYRKQKYEHQQTHRSPSGRRTIRELPGTRVASENQNWHSILSGVVKATFSHVFSPSLWKSFTEKTIRRQAVRYAIERSFLLQWFNNWSARLNIPPDSAVLSFWMPQNSTFSSIPYDTVNIRKAEFRPNRFIKSDITDKWKCHKRRKATACLSGGFEPWKWFCTVLFLAPLAGKHPLDVYLRVKALTECDLETTALDQVSSAPGHTELFTSWVQAELHVSQKL